MIFKGSATDVLPLLMPSHVEKQSVTGFLYAKEYTEGSGVIWKQDCLSH